MRSAGTRRGPGSADEAIDQGLTRARNATLSALAQATYGEAFSAARAEFGELSAGELLDAAAVLAVLHARRPGAPQLLTRHEMADLAARLGVDP